MSSVVSLRAPLASRAAGRTAPDEPEVTISPAPGRPWQLDDRDELVRLYARLGDAAIGRELHCAPLTVIRARERHGIASLPAGRRRGLQLIAPDGQPRPAGQMILTGTALQTLTRFEQDQQRKGAAPSDTLLAMRIHEYAQANAGGDFLAQQDARLAIASVAMLIHQHEAKLHGG